MSERATHNMPQLILDSRYTQSLLRIAGTDRRSKERYFPTARALPRREVLASLLLAERVYLSRPTWRQPTDALGIERLRREGLVEWIPDKYYSAALHNLESFVHNLNRLVINRIDRIVVPLDESPRQRFEADLDQALTEDETASNLGTHYHPLAFEPVPLAAGNLALYGLRYESSGILPLIAKEKLISLLPPVPGLSSDVLREYNGSFLSFWRGWLHAAEEAGDLTKLTLRFTKELGLVCDAAIQTMAQKLFAVDTGLPLKSASGLFPPHSSAAVPNAEEILIQCQFREVHYPVVSTIDDVLRLRNDPNLPAYREVLSEYTALLYQASPDTIAKVLASFRTRIDRGLRDLRATRKLQRISDYTFWISLPLAVTGFLVGMPMSIFALPISTMSKVGLEWRRRRSRWLLFGGTTGVAR